MNFNFNVVSALGLLCEELTEDGRILTLLTIEDVERGTLATMNVLEQRLTPSQSSNSFSPKDLTVVGNPIGVAELFAAETQQQRPP